MNLGGAGIPALGADCKCGCLSSSFASFLSNQSIVSSSPLISLVQCLFRSSQFFFDHFLHLSAAMVCMVRWLEKNCNKMIHDLIPSFKSLMAYVLPSQMLLLSPFPPFLCSFVNLDLRWMWWRKDWSVFLIFSVTDNRLCFPSDLEQKPFCVRSIVFLCSSVCLVANCGDELWTNFACQTSEMLLASLRRSFIILSNADLTRERIDSTFRWPWNLLPRHSTSALCGGSR